MATVTIASRQALAFLPQRIDGRDLHYWLEFHRSYASNTLRDVHRDAAYLAPAIAAHVRDAGALVRR